jgi:NTE family protein
MRLGIHRREFGCGWLQNTPPHRDVAEPHQLGADGVVAAPKLRDAILSMPRDEALRRHHLRERWTASRQETRKPSSELPWVVAQPVPQQVPQQVLAADTLGPPHAIDRDHRQTLPEPMTAESPPARRKDGSHRARPGRAHRPSSRAPARSTVLIDLALQGGGSHGAFTWGVLDRLLQEDWLQIEAVSGSSAGAMNAAVLADGWTEGGPAGARAALDAYWERVAQAALFSPLQRTPLDRLLGRWTLEYSPVFVALDIASRLFSPYDLNPRGFNPLTAILAESIDFKRLARSPIKLFITATNVHTGRGRIFRNKELSPEVLLASACLPTMFQAVEIDGEPYWDGGFAGNPTITPLVRESAAQDTILVQINPRVRPGTPRTAPEILNRLNEVSFNAPLMKELRMIALMRHVADPGSGEGARWASMRTHRIMTEMMTELGYSSKLNGERAFLMMLRSEGRRAADEFLATRGDDVGRRSTADLDELLAEC